jgi:prophage antirepressor-like protein
MAHRRQRDGRPRRRGDAEATDKDMETTLRRMREMTTIAEREMHSVVLCCKRARKQMLAGVPAKKPTRH